MAVKSRRSAKRTLAASTDINDIFNEMFLGELSVPDATNQAVQQADGVAQVAASGG